jgi:hypothetical protein
MTEDPFVDELVSLVQAQDRMLQILLIMLENEGSGVTGNAEARIKVLHSRVLDVQSEVMRINREGKQTCSERT